MKHNLIFLHAISGCDTVSAPYTKGKKRALEVLCSYGDQDSFSTFTEPRSTPEDIANVGERILAKVVWSRQIDIAGQTSLHPVHSISQSTIAVIRVQN